MTEVAKSSGKKWQTVLKVVAAYLVAAWTFLQFVDWILNRYDISPYWVDILLWTFVGVLPSLTIYLFHKDRINQGLLKLREKIIFPLNAVFIGIALYFAFGSSDLGSTTKEVTFTNNLGELEIQTITKEEFRIGIPIFNFKQKKKDTAHAWIENTINKLVKLDLEQNKTLRPSWFYVENTIDKIKTSRVFDKYYVDGEYEVTDSVYKITPVLRNSQNGNEIARKTFIDKDFFNAVDKISIFIKESAGLVNEVKNVYIDLDIKDITTSSIKALKYWSFGQYDQAIKIDESFAMAYFFNAMRRNKYSQGELEEKDLIDKAYKYRAKLPVQIQFEILMYKNIIYNRWKDAEELIKYQLEFEPNNETYNSLLDIIYSETKNFDGYYAHSLERFNKIKNETTAKNYYLSLILKREFKKAIDLVRIYEVLSPNTEEVQLIKAYTFLAMNDLEKAKETYKKIDLLWPKETVYREQVNEFIAYKEKNPSSKFDIDKVKGIYRSSSSEQQIEFYYKENNIMVHYKNQLMYPVLSYGDRLLSLNAGWLGGANYNFEKDSLNKVHRVIVNQFNQKNITPYYYYKESEDILKAYQLLKEHKYDSLKGTFKTLAIKYPNHWFLKQAEQHVNYISKMDETQLKKQFENVVGEYSNRKFWIENNRLFYKREGLTKVEIYPISNNRYINLTKLDTNYEFEFLPKNRIASVALKYDLVKNDWERLTDDRNYLMKN